MTDNTARLTSVIVEINTIEGWFDISEDVISSIKFKHGMFNIRPSDVCADIGTMEFTLNNRNNKYTSGVDENIPIIAKGDSCRLSLVYDGETIVRWLGTIDVFDIDTPIDSYSTIDITVLDYMDVLSKYSLLLQETLYNKTIDEVATYIMSGMYPLPENRRFDTGTKTYSTVFDAPGTRTSSFSELNKLALSELSYVYVRHDDPDGETLVVEGATSRRNISYTQIPINTSDSGYILLEDSDPIGTELLEYLVLDESAYSDISEIISAKTTSGKNLINQIRIKVYPRYLGSSTDVLFTLNKPIQILAGSSVTFKVTYADPSGGSERISGSGVYFSGSAMFQNKDGTGTNLTASLSGSSVDTNGTVIPFGAAGAILKLQNISVVDGYVTALLLKGTGIYFYNPIEVMTTDWTSFRLYGAFEEKLDQKYEQDFTSGQLYATLLVGKEKNPRNVLEKITMQANLNPSLMTAFLYNEIGDLVHVEYPPTGFSNTYFIHGIEANIGLDGIIVFTWTLLEYILFTTDFFQLDDAVHGMLDSNNVLSY